MAKIGMLLEGRYEILKKIGQGGMSTVYLAMDTRLNKQWAVKEVKKNVKDENGDEISQSAIVEANMIKQLDHPALPRIVSIIEEEEVIYIVMDYIEGETLEYVLNHQGAQDQAIVIEWAKQIANALYYLHTRTPAIIYRDMKPSNVMLKPDGSIKIIDFGIAREYKEFRSQDTRCLGTIGYAAPEQYNARMQTDARTDIYCLGVTLYHLVTGHNPSEPPYEIYPIRHWNPKLSGGLENIIEKCTQENPDSRYQTCAELLYALENYDIFDTVYKKEQKKKLNKFLMSAIMTVVLFIAGIGCTITKNQLNTQDYTNNINLAEKALSPEEKRDYLIQAINILPDRVEAYDKLIEAYKNETSFSVEEAIEFKEKVVTKITDLQSNDDYGRVAFEIGKLYWYYYDYGNNGSNQISLNNMTNAVPWFQDALDNSTANNEYHFTSEIYKNIGSFYNDLQIKINEGSSVENMFKEYYNNLNSMLSIFDRKEESEIVQLESYRLVMNSFETYAHNFCDDGVLKQDLLDVFNSVVNKVENLYPTSDKTKEMKKNIMSRLDQVEKAINRGYIESVVEEY